MECSRCNEHLIEYHYGELDPERRAQVAEHLSHCGECATAYCRLDADLSGVSEAVEEEPRPELRERLRAEVARQFRPSWWMRLLRAAALPIPAYQAVLGLAAVVAAWMLLQPPAFERTVAPAPVHQAKRSTPAAATTARGAVILKGYDASAIVRVSPDLL